MSKKVKKEEKMIRISAESPILSVDEILPESKVEKRLINIRDGFMSIRNRSWRYEKYQLKVSTGVYNPSLF